MHHYFVMGSINMVLIGLEGFIMLNNLKLLGSVMLMTVSLPYLNCWKLIKECCILILMCITVMEWNKLSILLIELWHAPSTNSRIISLEQVILMISAKEKEPIMLWITLSMKVWMMSLSKWSSCQWYPKLWKLSTQKQSCFNVELTVCLGTD